MEYTYTDYEYKKLWQEILDLSKAIYYTRDEKRRVNLKNALDEARAKRDDLRKHGASLPII